MHLQGAGMYLGCLTLLSITSSVRQRPQYMALTGISKCQLNITKEIKEAEKSSSMGPWDRFGACVSILHRRSAVILSNCLDGRVGGAFAQNRHATWRWSFYINLCIGAAFSPIYIFYLPRGDPQKVTSFRQKLLQIDYLGMVLNVGAFTALIMAINFGGNIFAWDSGREIALWVVGGVVLLLFILQQAFSVGTTETERVFPADFLNMPLMWLLFCLMNCAATCVFVSDIDFLLDSADNPLRCRHTTYHCTSSLSEEIHL